jgi:hypothetical protein
MNPEWATAFIAIGAVALNAGIFIGTTRAQTRRIDVHRADLDSHERTLSNHENRISTIEGRLWPK